MSKKQLSIGDFVKTPNTPNKTNPRIREALPAFSSLNKFSALAEIPSSSTPTKVPSNFKEAVTTSSQTPSPQSNQGYVYYVKPQTRPVVVIEPELKPEIMDSLNPKLAEIVKILFRKNELWINTDHRKTKDFYELILLDSQSIELTHHFDEKNKNRISHSRCKIFKVLSLDDWGQNPNTEKNFSILFTPSGYNYYDYVDAWYFIFLLRSFNHSWFFLIKPNPNFTCPHWFNDWWEDYGLCKEILPPSHLDGFTLFKTHLKNLNNNPLIAYSATFGIPWIMTWKFITTKGIGRLIWLSRQFSVKWWHRISTGQGDIDSVKKLFAGRNTILAETSSSAGQFNFLTDKSKIISSLSQKGSKKELKQALLEALSKVSSQEDSDEDTEEISGFTPENEDDCYNVI